MINGVCHCLQHRCCNGHRLAHPFNRFVQRAFGQGVRHKIITPKAQQLVQRYRAYLIGNKHNLDALGLGHFNDIGDARKIGLVLMINGNRHKFQHRCFGLVQKRSGIFKRKITPAFAKFQFHIVDQQIKILHIARNCARNNRCRFRL